MYKLGSGATAHRSEDFPPISSVGYYDSHRMVKVTASPVAVSYSIGTGMALTPDKPVLMGHMVSYTPATTLKIEVYLNDLMGAYAEVSTDDLMIFTQMSHKSLHKGLQTSVDCIDRNIIGWKNYVMECVIEHPQDIKVIELVITHCITGIAGKFQAVVLNPVNYSAMTS